MRLIQVDEENEKTSAINVERINAVEDLGEKGSRIYVGKLTWYTITPYDEVIRRLEEAQKEPSGQGSPGRIALTWGFPTEDLMVVPLIGPPEAEIGRNGAS